MGYCVSVLGCGDLVRWGCVFGVYKEFGWVRASLGFLLWFYVIFRGRFFFFGEVLVVVVFLCSVRDEIG